MIRWSAAGSAASTFAPAVSAGEGAGQPSSRTNVCIGWVSWSTSVFTNGSAVPLCRSWSSVAWEVSAPVLTRTPTATGSSRGSLWGCPGVGSVAWDRVSS